MIKKYILLFGILIITVTCTSFTEDFNIELLSVKHESKIYQITFLSKTDFSTRTSSVDTGSYVFCVADKEIYKKDFTPKFSYPNSLIGMIPKDTTIELEKQSNQFIYNIELTPTDVKINTDQLYCRVYTGRFIGSLRKSQVFELSL